MNTFTSQNRKEIKREMKARVKENLGRCIGIQLLYLVPYVLLMMLLYASVFGRAIAMLATSASVNDYQLMMALSQGMNTVWIIICLMLAITGPLQFGLMHFYVGLSRGEETGVSALFHPFTSLRKVWAGIRMAFTLWLRSVIWSIGPTLIYSILLVGITMVMGVGADAAYSVVATVLEIVYSLVMVVVQIKLQTYSAGWLLLVDDDSRGAWAATREAAEPFKGNLFKLFVFDLSFIGWYVLIALVLAGCAALGAAAMSIMQPAMGILVLLAVVLAAICLMLVLNGFLTAYIQTAFFKMYEHLSARIPSDTFYSMPNFSYTPVEPTEAQWRGGSAPQEPEKNEPEDSASSENSDSTKE